MDRYHRTTLVLVLLIVFVLYTRVVYVGSADKVRVGDTFWICDQYVCTKVRLCGAEAPEMGEPGSSEARAALQALVAGRRVRCIQVGSGTPCDGRSKPTNGDRIVVQCFVDDLDLAGALVAQGHACDWVKFSGGAYSKDAVRWPAADATLCGFKSRRRNLRPSL